MTKPQCLRMSIDITMTILSIILMGGNYLFPAEIVHEILGVGLFVLWSVHIFLNHRWYGAIFKGKYNLYRIMQTVINCCILICTIFLMISGIILSNQLFTFLNIQSGLGLLSLACAYGVYTFIARGVWKYLVLKQQFFFFDLKRGYVLFALDYISIIILFATILHLIASRLKKNR